MFHIFKFLSVGLFFIVCSIADIHAQVAGAGKIEQLPWHFHKVAQAGGLSSYYVRKIVQDKDGYTWIATQDGLNRYDGNRIIVYNKSPVPSQQLVSNDIWDLAIDSSRQLIWVLSYSGLNSIDLNTGRVLSVPPAIALDSLFPNGWFKCLQLQGQRLWIGSKDYNGIIVYNTARKALDSIEPLPLTVNQQNSKVAGNVDKLWLDEFGRIWAFVANYGIVLYSASSGHILQRHPLRELDMRPDLDYNRFRSVEPVAPGRLSVVTNTGLFEISYDQYGFRWSPFPLPAEASALLQREMYYAATDPRGRLWFGAGGALYRWDPALRQIVEIKDTDYPDPENWFGSIFCIFFDRPGHLWLGSQKGIAFSAMSPASFISYFQSADFSNALQHVYFARPYQDSLLLACAEDGLYLVNTHNYHIRNLAAGKFIFASQLSQDRMLVSGDDHLYILKRGQLLDAAACYPELKSIDNESINSLVWCGDTLAVMGSESLHGIHCWYPGKHSLENITDTSYPLHLQSSTVNSVYHDHRGRVWVLCDASVSIYDPRHKTINSFHVDDPSTHRPVNFYFDAAESNGLYWLAVYGTGLMGLDSNYRLRRFISTNEGMANAGVYKIFLCRDNTLLATSNGGLARIWLTDNSVVNYFQADGLHGNGFEEDCGYFDGRYIWAGGERGITRIDPAAMPADPLPPPLRVAGIHLQTPNRVFDIGDSTSSTLTVPSDVVSVTLTLSTFNYTDADRTSIFWRIPELKTQWIALEPEKTITLLGLSPGKYTLEAKASNLNSPGSQRNLALDIRWLPKWYQTLWFKVLVVAILLTLFYLFYRYRISQIRQQHRIRQSISSDLHDDIGSILNTIKIFTHLARENRGGEHWLLQIESSLAQAVVALRDMIWILDDSLDTVYELTERIRHFAIPATDAQGIQLEVAADPDLYHHVLLKAEKRNLLLIVKESVNNSLKYASCSRIAVFIGIELKSFTLKIEDDGVGFDCRLVRNGNGLKNIRQRAAQIHFTAEIDSNPGMGTRIRLAKR